MSPGSGPSGARRQRPAPTGLGWSPCRRPGRRSEWQWSSQASRGRLADALWPGRDPTTTAAGLNPLLSKLRRVLGADAIEGRSLLRLQLPDAWVDLEAAFEAIHRAESSVAQAEWARAWGPA